MKRRNFFKMVFGGSAAVIFSMFRKEKKLDSLDKIRGFAAETGDTIYVRGCHEPGDGGAGFFKWSQVQISGLDENDEEISFSAPYVGDLMRSIEED